jgi:dienelactone hydrolase
MATLANFSPGRCGLGVALACALACRAEDPPANVYADKKDLLVVRGPDGRLRPVRTEADWARRRQHILAAMREVMGDLPGERDKVPLDVRTTQEVRVGMYVRKKINFAVERGDRAPAWLLVPAGARGRLPGVLCLHQTTRLGKDEPAGLGGKANLHYAHELARRGFVCLAPDYPGFGEYDFGFPRGRFPSGSLKAVWNNVRGLDLLASLPEVDPRRLGCIGHSLGGHNALFTAAFDDRVRAMVSSCGFTSFPRYYGGNLRGWTSDRYMPRIATRYGLKASALPFDFPEVLAAIAPRAVLAVAPLHDDNFDVAGVRDCVAAARPVYGLLGAADRLAAEYPDCGHDFPPAAREAAYRWLERWLTD